MSFVDPLSVLTISDRNRLELLLMEFEETWNPRMLREVIRQTTNDQNAKFLEVAIPELVKVDLQRSWSAGCGQPLDAYLDTYPSLGTRETVRADLVAAEFEARSSVELRLDVSQYQSRYPQQYPQVQQILSERSGFDSALSHQEADVEDSDKSVDDPLPGSQATIDTSRIMGGQPTKKDRPLEFVSDLPVEFGRYRILRELGSGAMGRVYLAHDTQLDRQVALKTPSFTEADNEDLVIRFYREARSAAKLRHRNLCPVYDVGRIGVRHFISMAFIEGRPLADYVKPGKLPPPRSAAILVQRIAIAMAEAHRNKVIHRDLKPANIMIDRNKEPVVMDFGLARELDGSSQFTQQGVAVGTPAYMAPEQIRGELDEVGAMTDIYALGVILYELLTGTIPFRGPMTQLAYRIVHEEPKPPSELQSGIDSDLQTICLKMMAKGRAERYPSMNDVAAALRDYLKDNKSIGDRNKSTETSTNEDDTTSRFDHPPGEPQAQPKPTDSAALDQFLASRADVPRSAEMEVRAAASRWNDSTASFANDGLTAPDEPAPDEPAPDERAPDERTERMGESVTASSIQATDNAPQRRRPSFLWVAIGLALAGFLVGGVVFLLRSGDAVVRVVIDDPSIGFTIQDQVLTFDDNGREIRLRPTEHNKLLISFGESTFQTDGTFKLRKGENPVVEVTLLDGEVVATLGEAELGRWSLREEHPKSRSVWVHDTGFFESVGKGVWREVTPDGKQVQWTELTRSRDFIELRDTNGNPSRHRRLFADRAESATGAPLEFTPSFDGYWHTLLADAETEPQSPPVLNPGMAFKGRVIWNRGDAAYQRGTEHAWELNVTRVSGPRFWGKVQFQWASKPLLIRGICIGDKIQWTNSGNNRTCYGTFNGSTINTVAMNGRMIAERSR